MVFVKSIVWTSEGSEVKIECNWFRAQGFFLDSLF